MSTAALTQESMAAGRRPLARMLRLVAGFLAATAAGMAAALLVIVAVGLATGHKSFAVLSGSMSPSIATGDAVVDEQIAPLEARVGDVVTFKDPARGGALVTHRVRSVRPKGNMVAFVTKGDANNATERWNIARTGKIGRVVLRVPRAGFAIEAIRGRHGRLFLIALPALCLGIYELVRIWRPRSKA